MCRKVSALTEHSFLGSPAGRRVGVDHFMQQRLDLGIATTQGIKANALMREVDVATDQSVRPVLVDGITAAENIDSTTLIAAPTEDQRPRNGAVASPVKS